MCCMCLYIVRLLKIYFRYLLLLVGVMVFVIWIFGCSQISVLVGMDDVVMLIIFMGLIFFFLDEVYLDISFYDWQIIVVYLDFFDCDFVEGFDF